MEFELSEDQREIQRTATELLAGRSSFAVVRAAALDGDGHDAGLWAEVAELGWPGIAMPEEHGGLGLGLLELVVLTEELGFALAPVPFLGSALAGLAIAHGGDEAAKGEWLPRLAAGEAVGAFDAGSAGELVPDAGGADVVVVGGEVVAGGLERARTIDPTRRYGQGRTGASDPAGAALDRAAVVVAAELVGVSRRALEMTVAYVKDRQQFGVPVGAFQAVQHTAAKMLRDTEGARALTYYAAWAADAEPERLPEAAAMAKAATASAGRSVTADAIQLHGGIGFTWEADVHWLFKRAQLMSVYLGGAARHRARVAELVAAQRAAAADGAGPKRRTAPAPEPVMVAGG